MADNVEKRFANPSSPEGAPSLRAVKVNASSVGEAMEKAGGGAGQAELDWVLANPKEARKMLKGDNYFFFPEAAVGDFVPYVDWYGVRFYGSWVHRGGRWFGSGRVVQVG